jgi:hypothetical protein
MNSLTVANVRNVPDHDGNNVEAVYHGPTKRTAESIQVEPA